MSEAFSITTFGVSMTTTEYHHFEDQCCDAANIQVVDLNGFIQAHLITQIPQDDIPLDTDGINFHIEVQDPFTEEVFYEFDTNRPDVNWSVFDPQNTQVRGWW